MVQLVASTKQKFRPSSTTNEAEEETIITMIPKSKSLIHQRHQAQDDHHNHDTKSTNPTVSSSSIRKRMPSFQAYKIPLAVFIWYQLGVISISLTKKLLETYSNTNDDVQKIGNESVYLSPLLLTMQQFAFSVFFLRIGMYFNKSTYRTRIPFIHGYCSCCSSRLSKEKVSSMNLHVDEENPQNEDSGTPLLPRTSNIESNVTQSKLQAYISLSSIFFTIGCYLTNKSFFLADAAFVETIKGSEPIGAVFVSTMAQIDQVGLSEIVCLLGICLGLVFSTLSQDDSSSSNSDGDDAAAIVSRMKHAVANGADFSPTERRTAMEVAHSSASSSPSAIYQALCSCGIVLASNLSFSFRGLYHKKIRALVPSVPPSNNRNHHHHHGIAGVGGSSSSNDRNYTLTHATDTDIQYQTNLDGLVIMTIIWVVTDMHTFKLILNHLWNWICHISGTSAANVPLTLSNTTKWENMNQYIVWSIINGFAFSTYK